jgi:orotate phosphoribosyltransferase
MSSMAAVDALIDRGANVIGVLAIFTYGFEEGKALFTSKKIPLETLSNYRVLLQEAVESNYINQEEKVVLESWNKDPKAWKSS